MVISNWDYHISSFSQKGVIYYVEKADTQTYYFCLVYCHHGMTRKHESEVRDEKITLSVGFDCCNPFVRM